RSDLVGPRHPARRTVREKELLHLGGTAKRLVYHLGPDEARTNRVRADAALPVVERDDLSDADDPPFRRHVRLHLPDADDTGGRRGVHDRPTPAREHSGDLVLHAEPDALEIHGDDAVP